MRKASKSRIAEALQEFAEFQTTIEQQIPEVRDVPGMAAVLRHSMRDIQQRIEAGDIGPCTNSVVAFVYSTLKWTKAGLYSGAVLQSDGTYTLNYR